MDNITNIEKHIENAIDWFWSIIPNLVMALVILVVGLWFISISTRLLRKYFDKKRF